MPDYPSGYWAKDGHYNVTEYSHTPSYGEIRDHALEDEDMANYKAGVKRTEEKFKSAQIESLLEDQFERGR